VDADTANDPAHRIWRWSGKSKTQIITSLGHSIRGLRLNYRGEPSFQSWLMTSIPFIALGAHRRLSPWRWLLMLVPFFYLLDGEINNTAHEEGIRAHDRHTPHFRDALDSASASVMLRAFVALACALYALFGHPADRKSS